MFRCLFFSAEKRTSSGIGGTAVTEDVLAQASPRIGPVQKKRPLKSDGGFSLLPI